MITRVFLPIVVSATLTIVSPAYAGGAGGGSTSNGMSASAVSASLEAAKHGPSFIEAAGSILSRGTGYVSSGVSKVGSITLGFINGAMIDAITLIDNDPAIVDDWGDFNDAVDVAVEAKSQGVAGFTTGGSAVNQGLFSVQDVKDLGL